MLDRDPDTEAIFAYSSSNNSNPEYSLLNQVNQVISTSTWPISTYNTAVTKEQLKDLIRSIVQEVIEQEAVKIVEKVLERLSNRENIFDSE
jgi:hypothetical protein